MGRLKIRFGGNGQDRKKKNYSGNIKVRSE